MAKKKVLIIEDEILVAKDLKGILTQAEYDVVGLADSFASAKKIFESEMPDILLCDINIKGDVTGIDSAEKLKELKKVPVVYLTAYSDPGTVSKAFVTNPSAYLVKPFTEKQLIIAMKLACDQFYGVEKIDDAPDSLTHRELEILKLLSKGLNSKSIGDELHISRHTVITHRKNIHQKLGVKKTSEILLVAVKKGWIT